MEIALRKLGPSDLSLYRNIRLKCMEENPANFGSSYEEEKNKEKLLFTDHIQQQDPDNFVLGAFQGSELIGIGGLLRQAKRKTRHQARIVQFYVTKANQGRGIGKLIMLELIRIAFDDMELEQITLGVIADNLGASRLYEKLGFVEFGYLKNFLKLKGQYYNQRFMVKYK